MSALNYRALPGALAGSANLSTGQYYAVRNSTGTVYGEVLECTANTQRPIGIIQNDPASSGAPAEVALDGICRFQLGDTATKGAILGIDANGRGQIVAESSGTTGRYVFAEALEAGSTGEVIWVRLFPAFKSFSGTSGT